MPVSGQGFADGSTSTVDRLDSEALEESLALRSALMLLWDFRVESGVGEAPGGRYAASFQANLARGAL